MCDFGWIMDLFGKGAETPDYSHLSDVAERNQQAYIDMLNRWMGVSEGQINRQTDIQEAAIDKQMQLIDMMMGMTGEYWTKSTPVRDSVLSRLGNFMKSGMDPTTSVMYPAGKDVIESKYLQGKDEMLSTLPQGGGMYRGLEGLQRSKASSYLDLVKSIVQDEYNKAYGVATGAGNYGLLGNAIPGLSGSLNTSGSGINSLISSAMGGASSGLSSSNSLIGSLYGSGSQAAAQQNLLSSKLWDSLGEGIGNAWSTSGSGGDSGGGKKGGKGGGGGGGDDSWMSGIYGTSYGE